MKKRAVLLFFVLLVVFMVHSAIAIEVPTNLTCSIKASCNYVDNEVSIMNLYSLSGSHVEKPAQTSYSNKVCCSFGTPLVEMTADCDANYNKTILKLSSKTNAHVEIPTESNYGERVCMSTYGHNANISCLYNLNSCPADYTCIASISSFEQASRTNLHVAGCIDPDAFQNRICCKSGLINVTVLNGSVTKKDDGTPIYLANISIFIPGSLLPLKSALTNPQGSYFMDLSKYVSSPFSYFNIIAQHSSSDPVSKENERLFFEALNEINFQLEPGQGCRPDCTRSSDPYGLCSPLCEGINGCVYNSTETKTICTDQVKGARRILSETTENETVVYCCSGLPVVENKTVGATKVECPGGNVIKLTKIVVINGEPVKMNVVSCAK